MDCLCRGGNVCEKLLLLLQGLLHLHFCKCGKMYEENMHFLPMYGLLASLLYVVAQPDLTHYGKITPKIWAPQYLSFCDKIFSIDIFVENIFDNHNNFSYLVLECCLQLLCLLMIIYFPHHQFDITKGWVYLCVLQ